MVRWWRGGNDFCLFLQILLHENASVTFSDNFASELGAGLYVEYSSSDFILSVLNTGCFIRYNSTSVDVPPTEWVSHQIRVTLTAHIFWTLQKARMTFVNNMAVVAGAAIFANDMSRCRWLGGLSGRDRTIFQISEQGSPFLFAGNRLSNSSSVLGGVANETLATDSSAISAESMVSRSGSRGCGFRDGGVVTAG